MIKPTETFRAVVPGSAYPQTFAKGEEIAPGSAAASAALELGFLTKKDAAAVRKEQGKDDVKPIGKAGGSGGDDLPASGADTKSQGAAPENKSH